MSDDPRHDSETSPSLTSDGGDPLRVGAVRALSSGRLIRMALALVYPPAKPNAAAALASAPGGLRRRNEAHQTFTTGC